MILRFFIIILSSLILSGCLANSKDVPHGSGKNKSYSDPADIDTGTVNAGTMSAKCSTNLSRATSSSNGSQLLFCDSFEQYESGTNLTYDTGTWMSDEE